MPFNETLLKLKHLFCCSICTLLDPILLKVTNWQLLVQRKKQLIFLTVSFHHCFFFGFSVQSFGLRSRNVMWKILFKLGLSEEWLKEEIQSWVMTYTLNTIFTNQRRDSLLPLVDCNLHLLSFFSETLSN